MDTPDLPLPALFARGSAAHRASEAGGAPQVRCERAVGAPPLTSTRQSVCEAGVSALRAAAASVRRLSLFSANERVDDVGTSELKYLLVPFLLAELLVRVQAEDRTPLVKEALLELDAFLSRAESYGLVPPAARAARERAEPADAATLRAEKIARFKREKELASKLQALEELAARRGASRHAKAAASAEAAREAGEEEEDEEEAEREAWLLRLGAAVERALDSQQLWEREAALLALHAAGGAGGRGADAPRAAADRPRLGAAPPAAAAAAAALAAALATLPRPSDRQRLRAAVFRPSHILPSMSVEQFGEQELARMGEAGRAQAAREAERAAARAELGSDEEEEERVVKARSWDDWKDDHLFGSGNSKLRPCG